MKFKLSKTEHLSKVQLLNKISKNKITLSENKSISNDSLIFFCRENKIYLYSSNSISSALVYLCDYEDEFCEFGIESNLFCNAFTNFPVDDVQFIYSIEDNQLVFGNKKTRVALKSLQANNIDDSINKDLFLNQKIKFAKLDVQRLMNMIKYTSFSCAPDFDEHPYSSIMFFIKDGVLMAQSSDKHRISVFGERYNGENSYLLSKNQADLLLNFLGKDNEYYYSIYKNKLILKWEQNIFTTNLENNSFQSVFNSFEKFFNESSFITEFSVPASEIIKSVKFISNITSSHTFNLKTSKDTLIVSSSRDDKGAVADKILLQEDVENIDVSYLIGHFIKALDLVNKDEIVLSFKDYNGYTICVLNDGVFEHIMFPME